MKRLIFILMITIGLASCDTLQNIPTNTSGGFFSLNGNWSLYSTSDGTSMQGTTITVYPVTGSATVTTLANNNNCIREKDALWKDIKSSGSGVFSINALASNCNNAIVYRTGTITVLSNDEVRVTTQTVTGNELVQTWRRIK